MVMFMMTDRGQLLR